MNKLEKLWAEHKAKFIKADKEGKRPALHFKHANDLLLQRGWK